MKKNGTGTQQLLKIKLIFIVIISGLYGPHNAFAQTAARLPTGTIKGFIIDSASKTGIADVSVMLHEANGEATIANAITHSDGSFELTNIPYKRFNISITHISFKTRQISLPSFTSAIIFVGYIPLSSLTNQLQEVVVVSKKKLVEQSLHKIIYNVAVDADSKVLSSFDIMRKVPLLSIDINDKLLLNGSTGFQVHINGRPSTLLVKNASDVLKSMPASFIKKIEVITNPPARYDAQGIAGIINIITNKATVNGYNSSVNVTAEFPTGYQLGSYVTAKTGKFGVSVNAGLTANTSPVNFTNFNRRNFLSQQIIAQKGEGYNNTKSGYVRAEMSYELDSLNLISGGFSATPGSATGSFLQNVVINKFVGTPLQAYKNGNETISNWSGNEISLDYQRNFKSSAEKLLTLSYRLNNTGSDGITDISLIPLLNYYNRQSNTYNTNRFSETTLQVDYVQPLFGYLLETGLKNIYRNSNSSFDYKNKDTTTNIYIKDEQLSNEFNYNQQVSAGYIFYSIKKENWSVATGARLEATAVNANFKSSGTVAVQQYFNLLPNFTFMHRTGKAGSINASYTQRLERPSLFYLDPFIDVSDPRNIYYGNPNLLPATSHSFQVNYFTYINSTSMSAGVFHYLTSNSIERYTGLTTDSIAFTTYGNIGRNKTYGFSFSANTTLFKQLSLSLNGSGNYITYQQSKSALQINEGFTFDAFAFAGWRMKNGIRLNGSLNYQSATIQLQGNSSGYYTNSFSISKAFLLNKKLTSTLSFINPFQKERIIITEINDQTFHQYQESRTMIRRISFALYYSFGKLTEDIKRKKRGIKNDDLKNN